MATTKNVHEEYINAILARDWEKVKGLLHSDYTYMAGDGQVMPGAEAALAVAQTMTKAFPDLAVVIKSVFTAGDTAIAEMVATGTHKDDLMGVAATGKQASFPVCLVLELRDGKIYREREYYDSMVIFAQLGVVTPPGQE